MAAKDEGAAISDKVINAGERVFNLLWSSNGEHDLWHWILLIFIVLSVFGVGLFFILKTICALIEQLAKFLESYKSSGFTIWLNKDNKIRVRKRKQFCAVLDADLSYLAKAENWNDQYFTDLEAEVETEGGYYASALDKLRRKKSFGLRKERSLIRAISSSTERAMQLVGEPGSGKSVALRHLAKQFAIQGKKSNDKKATVPLYINLREMEVSNIDEINADSVRNFVLENIRRGDADTAAFVRENWEDYCNRGVWLFLFDSFDEIPSVLHSATGSNIIQTYSQALRQFLEGMGECRGILASREFKGPEALPWKKIRILPLSGEKQDELIRNSFLNESNLNLVRQHLASPHTTIGTTPLFLTLLCRYVRDEQRAPSNDHDILFQHIERLAKREPEYLERKYKLSPENLMIGAERLARLFAENDTLSLAPTLDQIMNQLPEEDIPGGSIERLISALVDCKIGRADVPNAAPGDRRFAFAHRRYQEALFVRYLTVNPGIVSEKELLTEARWREYTVTLLQTSELVDISKLLDYACTILKERALKQKFITCKNSCSLTGLAYYEWSSEIAIQLISLLQDGLSHRINDVPSSLSSAVFDFLKPRWEKGDSLDRREVLRLGGLLPENILIEYVVESFKHGTKSERMNAFRQATYTSHLPKEAQSVVLKMLFNKVISAKNRAEQLTVEAMAARLPPNIGANIVVSRAKKFRRNLALVKKFVPQFLVLGHFMLFNVVVNRSNSIIRRFTSIPLDFHNTDEDGVKEEIYLISLFMSLTVMCGVFFSLISKITSSLVVLGCVTSSLLFLYSAIMLAPFLVRYQAQEFNIFKFLCWASKFFINQAFIKKVLLAIIVFISFVLVSSALGYCMSWFITKFIPVNIINLGDVNFIVNVFLGFVLITILFYIVVCIKFLVRWKNMGLQIKHHMMKLDWVKKMGYSDVEVLCSAEDYRQLVFWLERDDQLLTETHTIRSFSSFVLSVLRIKIKKDELGIEKIPSCLKHSKEVVVDGNKEGFYFEMLRQILEDRLEFCK